MREEALLIARESDSLVGRELGGGGVVEEELPLVGGGGGVAEKY